MLFVPLLIFYKARKPKLRTFERCCIVCCTRLFDCLQDAVTLSGLPVKGGSRTRDPIENCFWHLFQSTPGFESGKPNNCCMCFSFSKRIFSGAFAHTAALPPFCSQPYRLLSALYDCKFSIDWNENHGKKVARLSFQEILLFEDTLLYQINKILR